VRTIKALLSVALLAALPTASLADPPQRSRTDFTAECSVAEAEAIRWQEALLVFLRLGESQRRSRIVVVPKGTEEEREPLSVGRCTDAGGVLYCDATGFACCRTENGVRECRGADWDPQTTKRLHRAP
jgi:hypothetical protein